LSIVRNGIGYTFFSGPERPLVVIQFHALLQPPVSSQVPLTTTTTLRCFSYTQISSVIDDEDDDMT